MYPQHVVNYRLRDFLRQSVHVYRIAIEHATYIMRHRFREIVKKFYFLLLLLLHYVFNNCFKREHKFVPRNIKHTNNTCLLFTLITAKNETWQEQ
jgi:hypothetical protein